MRKYYDLTKALSYCVECPICHVQISDANRYHNFRYEQSDTDFSVKREMIVPVCKNDNITINLDNGDVEFNISKALTFIARADNNLKVYQASKGMHVFLSDGEVFIIPHKVWCEQCNCYSFSVEINVDIKKRIVSSVCIMDELATIEQKKDRGTITHEIQNLYDRDITKYWVVRYGGVADSQEVILPLVSPNLFNPNETLQRIKKLLVFS